MGRIYRVPYNGTITAAGGDCDLFYVTPADDRPIRIAGWMLSQYTEVGDAAEENIRLTLRRLLATVTAGSGGSSVTPTATDELEVAAGFTARANDTTVATTSGTNRIMKEMGWNERNTPWEKWIPEEEREVARQGEAIVLRNESTLADDMSFSGYLLVEEM